MKVIPDLAQISDVCALGLAHQEFANHGSWAKSSPLPVTVSNISLEHSHAHLFMLPVSAFTLEWLSCDRDYRTHQA